MSGDDFAGSLRGAIARHVGAPGTIHDLQRLTGGANKTTWSFDADVGSKRGQFILQLANPRAHDETNPLAGVSPHLTADQDAHLMIAAVKGGVPAPRVRAILEPDDGLGPGYVTERVEGETLATKILRDEKYSRARATMAAQCGEILAAIHRIPVADVPFLMELTPAEHVAVQRKILEFHDFHLPALELGLKWAEAHVPRNSRNTVVHGDFRAGNFIVGEEGIRCVLDWEIGQRGDPMQDLGWVCVKTWRFGGKGPVGGFGKREDLFAAYEKASGHSVDPDHVRFWEAYGSVRWALGCLGMAVRGMEEVGIERCAIGRRIEEPLWDFFNLIEGRD
ncbi:MAG TPA: phosphotransferase family protein [Candidatus Acidoferrales bacterium]|nr:phosphotransferase family protein [Candidatus Acidoferrales bacterium]